MLRCTYANPPSILTSMAILELPSSEPYIRIETPYGAAPAELALAVGGLAIGTGEFASMAILPNIAHGLGTALPVTGHIISAYALGVVFGAPLITIFFAKVPRRAMLIGLMLLFAFGNLASALAPSYGALLLARFIAGIPHGAFFGVAALVAASLVAPERRARAVGRVMLGLTVANIFGVPLATWLGQWLGWRSDYLFVSALGILTMIGVRMFLPSIHAGGATPMRELGVFRRVQVWLTLAVVAVGFGGLFAVYTYVTPTLLHVTGVAPWLVPVLLGTLGVGMTAGSLLGGWLADKSRLWTIFGTLIWNAAALAAFAYSSANVWAVTLNLFAMGLGIAIVPAVQTRLMDVAGDAQTVSAALNHSAFNIANALGAWAGGVVVAMGYGLESTGLVGALLALGGVVLLGVSVATERRSILFGGRKACV
jgi:DHA1 family inner membrane transport protein